MCGPVRPHWGLSGKKIGTDTVPHLRLGSAEPTLPGRFQL